MKYMMKLEIPIYEWDLEIYRFHPKNGSSKLPKRLVELLNDTNRTMLEDSYNTEGMFGFCFWNEFQRLLAVVVCTENFDDEEYVNKFTHEISHAIDRMLEVHNISDTETRSYLTGWMYAQFRKNDFI